MWKYFTTKNLRHPVSSKITTSKNDSFEMVQIYFCRQLFGGSETIFCCVFFLVSFLNAFTPPYFILSGENA